MSKPAITVTNFEPGPGSVWIDDTDERTFPVTEPVRFIEAFGAVTFQALDNASFTPKDMSDFTLADGRILQGRFTKIQLAAGDGSLVAYR